MRIDQFEMERMQAIHWHRVEYDLSESGVTPLAISELLPENADTEALLSTPLAYPLSEGSSRTREGIAGYDLPIGSVELTERIRDEASVLPVPGAMLGADRAIRFGYGFDIEHTLAGLARVDQALAEIAR
jgi:hypothetical protein